MGGKRAPLAGAGPVPAGAAAIYETLRGDIVSLRLLPGARLSENELGLRFRTSRTPVREALFRLVDEGLIEVRPQRGTFVSRISLMAVKRARFIRSALEIAIIRDAAERGLEAAVLGAAEQAIALQRAAGNDPHRFKAADDQFHRVFADAIGYGDLWSVVESHKAQFDRVRLLSLPDVTPIELLIGQHLAILDAVAARDPDRAAAFVHAHLSIVVETATALLHTRPELIEDDAAGG
jgi:DNA-binding GntR family transcriptional regulator